MRWVAEATVLDKVVGYTVNGEVLHAATWTHRSVPAVFSGHAIDDDDYQRTFDDRLFQVCRPRQVAAYSSLGVSATPRCGRANGSVGAP